MTTAKLSAGPRARADFLPDLQRQIEAATRARRPYAVLACVPQHLPGEDVGEVLERAVGVLGGLLRGDDVAVRLDEGVLAVGLANTDEMGARVFAQRLQTDLGQRSAWLLYKVWETGIAVLPKHGVTASDLLDAAVAGARTRRRRLGAV